MAVVEQCAGCGNEYPELAIGGDKYWCHACYEDRIEQLEAVVEKLPKTADGVELIPARDRAYFLDTRGQTLSGRVYWREDTEDWWIMWAGALMQPVCESYSTPRSREGGARCLKMTR